MSNKLLQQFFSALAPICEDESGCVNRSRAMYTDATNKGRCRCRQHLPEEMLRQFDAYGAIYPGWIYYTDKQLNAGVL